MGVDLIEDSEMSAFAHSRLGNRNFVDDNSYSNLFGSGRKAEENKKARERQIYDKYTIDPKKEKDCTYLNDLLIKAEGELDVLRKTYKGRVQQQYIDALVPVVSNLKTKIKIADCAAKKQTEEAKKREEEALQQVSQEAKKIQEETTQLLSTTQPTAGGMSKTMKYALIGVGGLVVVVGLIAVLRRR